MKYFQGRHLNVPPSIFYDGIIHYCRRIPLDFLQLVFEDELEICLFFEFSLAKTLLPEECSRKYSLILLSVFFCKDKDMNQVESQRWCLILTLLKDSVVLLFTSISPIFVCQ